MKPKDEAIPILIHCATDEFGMINLVNLVDKSIEWAWQHPHWISVEDELPKPNGGAVITVDYHGYIDIMIHSNDGWHGKDRWCVTKGVVTHWMPLPQAPLVTDLNKKDLPPVSWQEGNILLEKNGGKE